jgi:hypothetical protein
MATILQEDQTAEEKIKLILEADRKNKPVSLVIKEGYGNICLTMIIVIYLDKKIVEGRFKNNEFSRQTYLKKISFKKIEHVKIICD